jgi:hypothetical protein
MSQCRWKQINKQAKTYLAAWLKVIILTITLMIVIAVGYLRQHCGNSVNAISLILTIIL